MRTFFLALLFIASTARIFPAIAALVFYTVLPASTQTIINTDALFNRVPISFTPTGGRFDSTVVFMMEGAGWMDNKPDSIYSAERLMKYADSWADTIRYGLPSNAKVYCFFTPLLGLNPGARFVAEERQSWNTNFFLGNNSSQWGADIPSYARIRHLDIYPGMDLVYSREGRRIIADFIIHPGANISDIQCDGRAVSAWITENGDCEVPGKAFSIYRYSPPQCIQVISGQEIKVMLRYRFIDLDNRIFGLEFGEYDRRYDLVIRLKDVSSSYCLKKRSQTVENIRTDSTGDIYVVGQCVFGGHDGPRATATYVIKILKTGDRLGYVTYIQGDKFSAVDETPTGLAIDALGRACLAGNTNSNAFPVTPGGLITHKENQGRIGYILMLGENGNHLVFSTLFGASDESTRIYDLALDQYGFIYVTGITSSSHFPVTSGAFDIEYQTGIFVSFVSKLSPGGGSLVYSSYIKGGETREIKVSLDECAYVAGKSDSGRLPVVPGSFRSKLNGIYDAFVMKVNRDGDGLLSVNYLGGSGRNEFAGLAVDSTGNAHVAIYTNTDTPTNSMYVIKLNSAGTDTVYTKTFPFPKEYRQFKVYPQAIEITRNGSVVVVGYTGYSDITIFSPDGAVVSYYIASNK